MIDKQLAKIARVASNPDIPMDVPMGMRTILSEEIHHHDLQIDGRAEIAALRELGRREELQHAVLFEAVRMPPPYMPANDTVKDIADLSYPEYNDPVAILALLRVYQKRQLANLHQDDQVREIQEAGPATPLELHISRGIEHATQQPFTSLCGLTPTSSRSRTRQRRESVDPASVLERSSMLCSPGSRWNSPTEAEMSEAREWVLRVSTTSSRPSAKRKRDEEPEPEWAVETWLLSLGKLQCHKAMYLAETLAAEGLCTMQDLRAVAGQPTVKSFGTLRAELETLCPALKERTGHAAALTATDYIALYSGLMLPPPPNCGAIPVSLAPLVVPSQPPQPEETAKCVGNLAAKYQPPAPEPGARSTDTTCSMEAVASAVVACMVGGDPVAPRPTKEQWEADQRAWKMKLARQARRMQKEDPDYRSYTAQSDLPFPRKDWEELEVLSVTSSTQWQQAIAEGAKREEAFWDIAFAMNEVADSYRTTADTEPPGVSPVDLYFAKDRETLNTTLDDIIAKCVPRDRIHATRRAVTRVIKERRARSHRSELFGTHSARKMLSMPMRTLCGITTKPRIFNFAGSCPARKMANSCEEVRTAIIGELSKRLSKNSKLICDIWRAAASPWTKRRSDLPRQDPALD
jgi:hypothetical protein